MSRVYQTEATRHADLAAFRVSYFHFFSGSTEYKQQEELELNLKTVWISADEPAWEMMVYGVGLIDFA